MTRFAGLREFQSCPTFCPLNGGQVIVQTRRPDRGNNMLPLTPRKRALTRIAGFLLYLFLLQFSPFLLKAQNLGATPQVNKAVQGQTASQPEGAFLNLVNWIGNVIAPVGAAICVVMAVISYTHGRGVARWAVSAAGLLMVSGLTRLLEFWIQQGQSGVQ
jgi:hypothetical protein